MSDKLLCYLSTEARLAYECLCLQGIDPELAFTIVEEVGGESVYELADDDGPSGEDDGP